MNQTTADEASVFNAYPRVNPVGKPLFLSFLILYVISMFIIGFAAIKLVNAVDHFNQEMQAEYTLASITFHFPEEQKVTIDGIALLDGRLNPVHLFTERQKDILETNFKKAFEEGTFGLINPEASEEQIALGAIIYAVILSLASILILPFFILFYVLVYKAWKSLLPVNSINPEEGRKMPSPVLAVVLLLIPLVNLYGVFSCLARLSKYGRIMGEYARLPYRGPGVLLSILYGILCIVLFISGFVFGFATLLMIPWLMPLMLLQLTAYAMFVLIAIKLWLMIDDFAPLNTSDIDRY